MTDRASKLPITRRRFLLAGACAGAGLALYAGEIERHWIEITHRDVFIPGLPQAFDGFRVAQLSDIHLDEYTEPFFLRDAVRHINRLNPDAVFLTGDYVTHEPCPRDSPSARRGNAPISSTSSNAGTAMPSSATTT